MHKFRDRSARKAFKSISEKTHAVYRATEEDKELFISGLKDVSTCAIAGSTISDAKAIGAANVGFGLGLCGCDVAKDQADIILLDDDFKSIFNAVRWGRNVFDNCRKFVQF